MMLSFIICPRVLLGTGFVLPTFQLPGWTILLRDTNPIEYTPELMLSIQQASRELLHRMTENNLPFVVSEADDRHAANSK